MERLDKRGFLAFLVRFLRRDHEQIRLDQALVQ